MLKDKYWYLKNFFKYEKFRDGQEKLIDYILNKQNILAILPTGAGKSLIYQIPALMGSNYSIVVSPLISLMQDQVYKLNLLGDLSAFINSSLNSREISEIYNKISNNKIKLLYVAPERLENPKFINFVKQYPPDYLFIDEAHCISQWGNSFRPSYTKIKDFISIINPQIVAAFTASATQNIIEDIITNLNLKNIKVIKTGFFRDNLSINILHNANKKQKLVELLNNNELPGIVYVSTRKNAEDLSFYLNQLGFKNECYHAGLLMPLRKKIQDDFVKGKINLIIATNAFGMGVDKPDIRLIIHYNSPNNFEAYYQEIGRAGRDGKLSKTFLLYNSDDDNINNFFIDNTYPDEKNILLFYDFLYDNAVVAVGSKSNDIFSFQLSTIQRYFKQNISENSVDILLNWFEKYKFIQKKQLTDQIFIKILYLPDELKSFLKKLDDEQNKIILTNLINIHSNKIFEKFVGIAIDEFAEWLDLSKEIVSRCFDKLEQMNILSLQKLNAEFNYYLLKEREKFPDLQPIISEIKKLKKEASENYQKFKDFIYTTNCRMSYLVNYFGEQSTKKCSICDNCTSSHQSMNISFLDFIINKTLEIEPYLSDTEILEIIKGRSDNNYFPTFGLAQGYPDNIIKEILLKYQNRENIKQIKKLYKKEDIELYQKLKKIRDEQAVKFNQSPEKICSDELLCEIALVKPKNIFELLSIKGFNKVKYNKIGEKILEIININYSK